MVRKTRSSDSDHRTNAASSRGQGKRRRTAGPARGGQDPTRSKPAGSRTETRIARESALGSDNAADDK